VPTKQLNPARDWSRIRPAIRFAPMKFRFKNTCGLWLFPVIRQAERRLPVQSLYRILKPYALGRAALRGLPAAVPLPAGLGTAKAVPTVRHWRVNPYLNQILEYFPDRLAEPKWAKRCHIAGLDHLRQARQNRRPVVLAFCHFGPFFLLRSWLRAAGFPVAALVGGKGGSRSPLRRQKDRVSIFSEIPTAFHLDQLRAADEFLAAGHLLMVAIDTATGRQISVPAGGGWTFQMATGALRLAIRHRAELIPFSMVDEGRWRFQIELGRPVPAECLVSEDDLVPAGKHLLDELLPRFRNHPELCSNQLIQSFHPPLPDTVMANRPEEPLPSRPLTLR
jgi:lauroyl/myristoyl acyltransferase